MKKHLFLTGRSGCGKTTLIRNVLGPAMARAGGFITVRSLNADGGVSGFDLYPAAAGAGVDGFEPKRFLDCSGAAPIKNNEIFRVDAVRLLQEAACYPFSVIDEFGGYELLIPQFREALAEFLSGGRPCIGVLKGEKNADELRQRFGLGDKFTAYTRQLRASLEADADTQIVTMTGRFDNKAMEAVSCWAKEYVIPISNRKA